MTLPERTQRSTDNFPATAGGTGGPGPRLANDAKKAAQAPSTPSLQTIPENWYLDAAAEIKRLRTELHEAHEHLLGCGLCNCEDRGSEGRKLCRFAEALREVKSS